MGKRRSQRSQSQQQKMTTTTTTTMMMMMMLLMMMMTTLNFCCCCRDDLLNQIQTRNRIEVILYIEGTNQDKDDKRTGEGKEVTHSFFKKEKYILTCRT